MSRQPTHRDNVKLTNAYLQWLKSKHKSQSTIYTYSLALRGWVSWLGDRSLIDARVDDVDAFSSRLTKAGLPRAAASQRLDIVGLVGLYKWLVSRGVCAHNPAQDSHQPQVRNEAPKAIPLDTWATAWTHPSLSDPEVFVLGSGFFCGLRREEMCRLRRNQVDLSRQRLVNFTRKGGGDDTFAYGSAVALFAERLPEAMQGRQERFHEALGRLVTRQGENPYALPWGLGSWPEWMQERRTPALPDGQTNPNTLNKRLCQLLERAGAPHFGPHALRHSFVTWLVRMHIPIEVVRVLANHSSLTITQRYIEIEDDPLARYLTGQSDSVNVSKWG